jgi:glycosyltransferase involved in cell wall biosynthesis
MQVGYFTSFFPSSNLNEETYGSTRSMGSLINNISKKGIDAMVFTTSANNKDIIEERPNLNVIRYKTTFNYLTTRISISQFLKPLKYDVDIAHVNFDIPPGPFAGLCYAKYKSKPLVVSYRGDWDGSYGSLLRRMSVNLFNRSLVRSLLDSADLIISPTKSFINGSSQLRGIREKCIVIPNGICLDEYQTTYSKEECRGMLNVPQEKKILLYMGSLYPHKGPNVLIMAMVHVVKQYPDALLLIGGTGVIENELKQLVKELKLQGNVEFLGFVSGKYKIHYYKASDLFVLPSLTESFGNVNLEAMASGLPIVASNVGGIPDVVKDGISGLLSIPGNPADLAEKILRLLDSETLRDRFGKTGIKLSKEYSWDKIADLTKMAYAEVL